MGKGVVRDPEVRRRILDEILAEAPGWGARALGSSRLRSAGRRATKSFSCISSTRPRRRDGARPPDRRHGYARPPRRGRGARQRVEQQAAAIGVELGAPEDDGLDLLVVLGGDGTMLQALRATLGTGTPVFGINFGRVGFLTTVDGDQLDSALGRALAGDVRVVDLCTLEARLDGETHPP